MALNYTSAIDQISALNPLFMSGQPLPGQPKRQGVNLGGAAQQIQTITVTATGASTAFSVVLAGNSGLTLVTVTGTTGADVSDASGFAAAVMAALQADEVFAPRFSFSRSAGVITLTTLESGVSYTVTSPTSGVGNGSTTTSASNPVAIRPGRAIMLRGTPVSGRVKVGAALVSAFSPQVRTATYSSVTTNDTVITTVEMIGRPNVVRVETAYATSQTATLAAHAAALETELNSVFGAGVGAVATSTATTVVITADIAGEEFKALFDVQGGGGGTVSAVDTTGPSISTSLRRALAGISLYSDSIAEQTSGSLDGAYPAEYAVPYIDRGVVPVSVQGSPSAGAGLWVNLYSTNPGELDASATAADSPVWLGDLLSVEAVPSDGGGVAIVRINR